MGLDVPFSRRLGLVALLGLVYALLFHGVGWGINVLLFDGLLLVLFARLEPETSRKPLFIVAAAGLLFSALSVVIVHSGMARFGHWITLFLVIGLGRERELRFFWYGLLLGVLELLRAPLQLFRRWRAEPRRSGRPHPGWGQLLIPPLLMLPFFALYWGAGSSFAALLENLGGWQLAIDSAAFWNLLCGSWLGVTLCVGRLHPSRLTRRAVRYRDKLDRRWAADRCWLFTLRSGTLALTSEWRTARLSFLCLNGLLGLMLTSELVGVTLLRRENTAAEFSRAVHEGTYLLMFSVFLAIGVVLFFFRGLLNFHPRARGLARLAKIWIGLNAALAGLVGLRNALYVQFSGLAWGRVLVFFFLALLAFGLFTLWRKVARRLSLAYLFHANGMALWLGLLLLGAVNWDGIITRYNFATQHPDRIDYEYLIGDVGNGNAFLLARYSDAKTLPTSNGSYNAYCANRRLHEKLTPVTHRINDWREWNFADVRNYVETKKYYRND